MKRKFFYVRDKNVTYMYLGSKEWKDQIGRIVFSEGNKRVTLYISAYTFNRSYFPFHIQGNSLQDLERVVKLNINNPTRKVFHFKSHKKYTNRGRNAIYKGK